GLWRGASRRNTRSDRRPKTKARAHVVNGDPRNGSTIVGTPAFRLSPADADPNGSPERQPAAHAGRPEPHRIDKIRRIIVGIRVELCLIPRPKRILAYKAAQAGMVVPRPVVVEPRGANRAPTRSGLGRRCTRSRVRPTGLSRSSGPDRGSRPRS